MIYYALIRQFDCDFGNNNNDYIEDEIVMLRDVASIYVNDTDTFL